MLPIALAAVLPSINRNIVECKDQCGTDDVFQIIRINRNIVECKEYEV